MSKTSKKRWFFDYVKNICGRIDRKTRGKGVGKRKEELK